MRDLQMASIASEIHHKSCVLRNSLTVTKGNPEITTAFNEKFIADNIIAA